MIKRFCIGFLALCLDVQASVSIQLNDTPYFYPAPPTMAEVLAPVALTQNWYWPASKLFKLPAKDIEHERSLLLAQLETLKAGVSASQQSEIRTLQHVIRNWQLAKRLLLPIDFDRARLEPTFNRRFDGGDYIFQLNRRPMSVTFWGAMEGTLKLNHKGVSAVADYMSALPFSVNADKTFVWVVQPDGDIQRIGVASWNYQHIEVMPGATVFVPFAGNLFNDDLEQLNERLVALSLHRVE